MCVASTLRFSGINDLRVISCRNSPSPCLQYSASSWLLTERPPRRPPGGAPNPARGTFTAAARHRAERTFLPDNPRLRKRSSRGSHSLFPGEFLEPPASRSKAGCRCDRGFNAAPGWPAPSLGMTRGGMKPPQPGFSPESPTTLPQRLCGRHSSQLFRCVSPGNLPMLAFAHAASSPLDSQIVPATDSVLATDLSAGLHVCYADLGSPLGGY